ncbi:VOC family protein [Wenzhouxiangella sp. AB-CW3]|uniref:VOC family protein n=1 Tax=Wenzhouxiangella sp. AB-CW3 TaxID=2771012 RepID=UPI00168BD721|nr:VOC family protein [Wenzhouxiangella sp. AB-CW3]QOC21976.1 VOC family protein [Wenzhouxiangella sp. AB-CW3]
MHYFDLLVDNIARSIEFYTHFFGAGLVCESGCGATLSLGRQRQLRLRELPGIPRPVRSSDLCVPLSTLPLNRVMLRPGAWRTVFQGVRAPNSDHLPVRIVDPDGHMWSVCLSPSMSPDAAK